MLTNFLARCLAFVDVGWFRIAGLATVETESGNEIPHSELSVAHTSECMCASMVYHCSLASNRETRA